MLEKGALRPQLLHPWAAPKRPILNKVNKCKLNNLNSSLAFFLSKMLSGGYIGKFTPNFLWFLLCTKDTKYQCNHLKNHLDFESTKLYTNRYRSNKSWKTNWKKICLKWKLNINQRLCKKNFSNQKSNFYVRFIFKLSY